MKTLFFLLLVLITGISCSKGTAADKDTVSPVITINSPLTGQNFTPGQTIQISGSVTDDKYIAEIHIHVSNTNTGALLMDVHIYPTGSSATFDQPLTAVAGINYKIQLIAIDRAVNETVSSVEVSCN